MHAVMTTQSRGAGEPTHIVNRDGSDGPLIWRRATTQKRRDVMQLAQLRTPRGARKRERRRERRCDRRAVDRGVWCMRTAGCWCTRCVLASCGAVYVNIIASRPRRVHEAFVLDGQLETLRPAGTCLAAAERGAMHVGDSGG